jgi:putative DNA primase/helicase
VAAAKAANDPDVKERRRNVKCTFERLNDGNKEVEQRSHLEELLGEPGKKTTKLIAKWLSLEAGTKSYSVDTGGFIRNKENTLKPIVANAIRMLKTTPEWQGVLAFNRMTLFPVKLKTPPWEKAATGEWTDHDDTKLAEWFQQNHLFVETRKAGEAAQAVAHENEFHPVKDYLDGLAWDGTPRLDVWLLTYLGADDTPYARAVGRCWLISAVARVYRPGCQADYTLLLEGPQGILKSSVLATLAGEEFFLDNISEIESKDALLKIHAAWIVELAELAGLRRSDVEKIKSFLTSRTDKFRAPYDHRVNTYPRMNVFAGSTNDTEPFTDETGNRRFWPVRCGIIDLAKLKDARDQLWGEAVARFKKGEKWWLTPELDDAAAAEQRDRYAGGQWDELIRTWLENPKQRELTDYAEDKKIVMKITPWNSTHDEVTSDDVLIHAIGKEIERWTHADKMTVAKCLKHNGWIRDRIRDPVEKGGTSRRIYRRPSVLQVPGVTKHGTEPGTK